MKGRSKSAPRIASRLQDGRRRGRREQSLAPLAMTPFGPEWLEDRTLMTALSPAVVQALIAPVNDANQTGGGLAVLQEWAGALSQSGLYNQTLPIVDESVGQLLDLGQQVGSQISGPASTYLTGNASPTAEGLLGAILASDNLTGGSFTSTGGVDTFTLPSLHLSNTASFPIDLGHDASLLNIAVAASAHVNVTTALNLNVAFSVDTATDQFSVAIKPSSLTASLAVPDLDVNVSFGLLGGQIAHGNLNLTAGLDFQTTGANGVTVAQLFGGEASPDGILATTVDASTGLSATLPMTFSLNGQSLTSNPLPTVTVTDAHPFDGTAPQIRTANFGNLINFSDIGPSRLLSLIENLGSTFSQFSASSFLATPIPFTDTTVGSVLDFGAAFADKLTNGLKTIKAPAAAPTAAPTGGGATGGHLAPGTYFAEITFATTNGESAPSPVSTTFTVATGQIPRITLPAAPSGQTINLYLSNSTGAAGSATLYRSGITAASTDLDQAATASASPAPTVATQTPLFDSVQTLASLLGQLLATSPNSPFQVNPTFTPKSATNPDELTFQVSFNDTLANVVLPLDFNLALGSIAGLTTNASLQVAPTVQMGFTFGINLDPTAVTMSGSTPAAPALVGSALAPIPTTGQIGSGANFTLTIGTGTPLAVALPASALGQVQSIANAANPNDPTTLVGQLNLALGAIHFGTGKLGDYVTASLQGDNIAFTLGKFDQGSTLTIGVPGAATNPMATKLGFADGQTISLAAGRGSVSSPIPSNGRLGAASSFTVMLNGTAYAVNLPLSATANATSIFNSANASDPATLVGQLNLALAAAGIGSEVVAGYANGNITLTLQAFDRGTTLEVDFAATDPMATVLGFTNGQAVHASSGDLFVQDVSASGSLNIALTTTAGASSFATARVGPLAVSIGSAQVVASGSIGIQLAQGSPITLSTLVTDFQSIAGIKSIVSVTPTAALTATLTGLTVAAGDLFSYTPPATPSLTVTALDPLDAANTLSLADSTQGKLNADLYFQVALDGGKAVTVHVTQAATAGNTSVANLVAEINAALTTALGAGRVQAVATDDGTTTRIVFALAPGNTANTAIVADHFITAQYTNFGSLFNFSHLSLSDIANGIQQAVHGLSQYSSLGFLNAKLPIINKSVVDLVDYGTQFATAFANLQTDPNGTLQGYGDAIAAALGLPAGSLALSYDAANQALKILLVYQPLAYDQYLPLDLDLATLASEATSPTAQAFLQGLSSLIDLSGKSRVHVQAGVTLTLDLGLKLDANNLPSAFLYNDTGVSVTALVSAANASFNASIGPLALTIQGGSATLSADGKSTTAPAQFRVGLSSAAGNPTLTSFLANLKADTAVTLQAGAGLSLPMTVAGASLGTFAAAIPDVRNLINGVPQSVTITTPDIKSALKSLGSISGLLRNPQLFLQPLNSLLGGLKSALTNQLGAASLPLIGSKLQDAGNFLGTIQDDILAPIATALKSSGGDPGVAVANAMQAALRAIDPNATVVAVYSADGTSVQFNIHLSGDEDATAPFDLGLAALGLDLNGSVAVDLHWELNLDVGLSSTDGFYVIANPISPTTGAAVPIIQVGVSVTLPGTSFTGSLGFLQLSATNNAGGDPGVTVPGDSSTPAETTGLFGSLTAGLNAAGTVGGRLTLAAISGSKLSSLLQLDLDASAWVNLHLLTTINGDAMFPSFATDFVLDWQIGQYSYGQGATLGAKPLAAFENVQLGLGTFISNFVAPILDKIKPIFDAVEPVVKILTQRIPVISDLAGQTISLATLAEALDPKHADDIRAFLADFQNLYDLINSVAGAEGGNLMINFGSFDLDSLLGDLRGVTSISPSSIDFSKLPSMADLASQLNAAPAAQASFARSITKTGGSLQFPIIQNPSSVLELLLGQTIDLFTYSTPTLTLGFNYTQEFPIFGPLVALLGGNVGASIHFAFGYDTYGIQEWAHAGFAASQLVPDLADGFYAVADGTPNVTLSAGITAGAGIDLGLISGGVQGGIYATISMTLNDPDQSGKLRLETFIAELAHPLSIFTVSGRVYAQLSAYLTVGFSVFSKTFTFNITPEITLLTFSYTAAPTPTLATMGSGGSLDLSTGPNSANRGTGNTNQGDQTFTVSHSAGSAGHESVTVTAYGYTTTYNNVSTIVATGGLGNDTLDMTGVQSDTTITGGQGHNTIIGGSGRNTLVENQFSNYTLTSGGLLMDGSNSDTFRNIQNVVLTGPTGGQGSFTLSGYVGDSTLAAHGGNNSFNIDLSADGLTRITDDGSAGNPDNVVITLADGEDTSIGARQVVQGVNTIDYSGDSALTTLTINGTQANTRYTIQDTPAGPISTTLNTGDGNDTVFVEKTSGPTTVNAGAGTTTVDVGSRDAGPGGNVASIGGTLTVATVIGITTLNVDDTGDTHPANATLTSSSLTGLGMGPGGILYSNLSALNLALGLGGTAVAILGTLGFNTTTITSLAAGLAHNTFNVGSTGPRANGVVAGIAGPLIVQGSGRDTLNLDDSGDSAAQTLLVTGTALTQLGMAAVPQGITYGGLAALNVFLGTGGDTASVQSTTATTVTTINGAANSKANTFDIGSLAPTLSQGVVAGIAGPLIIAGSGADTMNVDDTGDTNRRTSTLTDTTLTGLGLGTQGITFTGLGTLTINLGPGSTALTVNIANDLPALTTVNAGTVNDTAVVTYHHNLDGILNLVGFMTAPTSTIAGNLYGNLDLTRFQTVPYLMIGGSVMPGSVITGVNILRMTVGGSFYGEMDLTNNLGEMDVAGNMTGLVNVGGTLTKAVIQGSTPGLFEAKQVGAIDTIAGTGPVVLQVIENGIERRVDAASVGNPYPLAAPLHQTSVATLPNQVTFRSIYEGFAASNGTGGTLANPQISMRVVQAAKSVAAQQYDLSFDTWNDAAKFDLARLDVVNSAGGPVASGIRDVAVEGDLLTQVTPTAQAFLGLANNQGGIRLPSDNLAGVAIRDYAPQRMIQAASVQSVAFGSFSQDNGKVLDGSQANNTNAAELITTSTGFNQAIDGTTFRIPFADEHNVALFFVALANTHNFDLQDVLFTDQHAQGGITTDPRGGVTALVTTNLALAGTAPGTTRRAQLTSVALNGDGGSFSTGQAITKSITSTGALGDVTLSAAQGLTANLTAPSIFGSIRALGGPIAGTIQATGIRIDPITGAQTTVGADIGQLTAGPNGTMTDSQILAGSGGITGKILAGGNLVSQVVSKGPISGLIAARGNIGVAVAGPGGTTVRYGGITSQGLLSGQVVASGNILGDLSFQGGLAGGQVAAKGSILGNVVAGSMDAKSSIIAGGSIGSATAGTSLSLASRSAGLVAAKGAVRLAATSPPPTNLYQSLPAGPSASAIDALFAQVQTDLATSNPYLVALEPVKLKTVAGRLTFGP